MAVYEGVAGAVYLAPAEGTPTELLGVRRWTLREESDKEETTRMGQGNSWRSYAPTLRGATATIEAYADTTEARWRGNPPVISAGNLIDVELYESEAVSTLRYGGRVLVDSVEAELSVDGILTLTVQGTVTGPLAYPTLS